MYSVFPNRASKRNSQTAVKFSFPRSTLYVFMEGAFEGSWDLPRATLSAYILIVQHPLASALLASAKRICKQGQKLANLMIRNFFLISIAF